MKMTFVKLKIFAWKHFVLTIGCIWLLVALLADFVIVILDLQYDDGGLGTVLILGRAVYAFPVWFLSEISMPLKINEYLSPYIIALLGFVVLDLLISKIIQTRKNSVDKSQ